MGINNAEAKETEDAGLAEIFNAYLLWLENDQPENYTVEAPPKSCIYFLPPDEANAGIKKLLREKLQQILSAKNIETALAEPVDGVGSRAFIVLRHIIIKLKDQGINAAYLIEKILQILG